MYSEKVMEHFKNPRNVGSLEDPDGVGQMGNPVCGDIMRMEIKVKDDRIEDAKFKTFGCGAAIATSSMVTELVKGKTINEALAVSNKAVAEALDGLPPVKMHCSNLAADALHKAIKDYLTKKGDPRADDIIVKDEEPACVHDRQEEEEQAKESERGKGDGK
jgi:nitrogen fixation NifU-like protein